MQSRINEELPFNRVEKHSSGKIELCRIHEHEIKSLKYIVDALMNMGLSLEMLDGFFYGYRIPQIGKEFDLLKFTETECLNIELKSQAVPLEQVLSQLKKNKYYLAHLGKKEHFYTVITDTMTCYMLDQGDTLQSVEFSVVANDVKNFGYHYLTAIDHMFRASDYLVSPLKHCGKLSKGQERLNESIKNFHVIAAGYLKYHPEIIRSYNFILVDETHRIYPKHYDEICDLVMRDNKICIFSSDPEQVLSSAEKRNGIVQKINSLPLIDKYELSEKIRTNKELASFIISVRNLNKKPHIPMDYGNVILSYANNYEEACNMIEYFKKQGYVFINYSKSNYNYSPYAKYEEDFDTHHVIGQEFDNVLMLMDDSFYYDENGVLQGVPHPNPDYLYPNLFYQGITRVREKIALVIVNSPRLFEKISSIFDIEQEA